MISRPGSNLSWHTSLELFSCQSLCREVHTRVRECRSAFANSFLLMLVEGLTRDQTTLTLSKQFITVGRSPKQRRQSLIHNSCNNDSAVMTDCSKRTQICIHIFLHVHQSGDEGNAAKPHAPRGQASGGKEP